MTERERVCKLVLLGNGSVGKTSICRRFLEDGFSRVYRQTHGVDFFQKRLELQRDEVITVRIYDIGGQSLNSPMLPQYVSGADVIFLCYDVTDAKSFDDAEDWLDRAHELLLKEQRGPESTSAEENAPTTDQPATGTSGGDEGAKADGVPAAAEQRTKSPASLSTHFYAVGNKVDIIQHRKVSEAEHNAFVERHQLKGGVLVSAQNGDAITRSVYAAAAEAVGKPMSDYDLEFHDRVVGVVVQQRNEGDDAEDAEDEEARSANARFEAEVERAQWRSQQSMGCGCHVQ